LESETEGKEPPDLIKLREEAYIVNSKLLERREWRDGAKGRLLQTERMLKELRQSSEELYKADKSLAAV